MDHLYLLQVSLTNHKHLLITILNNFSCMISRLGQPASSRYDGIPDPMDCQLKNEQQKQVKGILMM
ncbi:hypothetical protein A3195_12125 [Candidatus Thiodiazotropha endoloripes]|nr:hypothetical protein A3195_12125 [Candidatus Thiodiazotropha endoloripes]ODB88389.1 hypothetical protein A3193_05920 [Candidatus Thiodiazotropha endoloripes]